MEVLDETAKTRISLAYDLFKKDKFLERLFKFLDDSEGLILDDESMDDIELWRPVGECPNHRISSHGRVAHMNGRFKKISYTMRYPTVSFCLNGKTRRRKIHRLVALAFIPNPENKKEVNHIDCDRGNNHVKNLEWATAQENSRHAQANGLYGNRYNLTVEIAREIRKKELRNKDYCKLYNVSPSVVTFLQSDNNSYYKYLKLALGAG